MKAISVLVLKSPVHQLSNSSSWRLIEFSEWLVVCDNFISKYIGDYSLYSYCYFTLCLNNQGLVRFKKYVDYSDWVWTFDNFPKKDINQWEDNVHSKHELHTYLNVLLGQISNSNNGITDFRADVYMTDVDYSDDLKKELDEEESLKLIGETF